MELEKIIKKANIHFEERPDYIRFETNDDIIEVRPTSWELIVSEKDTGDEYNSEFETREKARDALINEIKELKIENDKIDDEEDDEND